jgi:hypothetical protein
MAVDRLAAEQGQQLRQHLAGVALARITKKWYFIVL